MSLVEELRANVHAHQEHAPLSDAVVVRLFECAVLAARLASKLGQWHCMVNTTVVHDHERDAPIETANAPDARLVEMLEAQGLAVEFCDMPERGHGYRICWK